MNYKDIKEGVIIICINNKEHSNSQLENKTNLTEGKGYKVVRFDGYDRENKTVRIINDNNRRYGYFIDRFVTQKEYRKEKLLKLNDNKKNRTL